MSGLLHLNIARQTVASIIVCLLGTFRNILSKRKSLCMIQLKVEIRATITVIKFARILSRLLRIVVTCFQFSRCESNHNKRAVALLWPSFDQRWNLSFFFFCLNTHGQQTTFCPSWQPNQQELRKDYQEACLKRASADDPCNLLRLRDLRNPVTKQDFVCLLRTRLFVCPFVCCFNWIWCFRGSLQRISSTEKTFFFLFRFLSFLSFSFGMLCPALWKWACTQNRKRSGV